MRCSCSTYSAPIACPVLQPDGNQIDSRVLRPEPASPPPRRLPCPSHSQAATFFRKSLWPARRFDSDERAGRATRKAAQGTQPSSNGARLAKSEEEVPDWERLSIEELEGWTDSVGPATPLLDTVNYPVHIKNLSISQLRQLCKEIRSDLVHSVSQTGGHLGSSLGVVELTVALHHVFECPADKMIWDVGHQAYVHKILTGRRSKMSTIRQAGGLSGAQSSQAS